MNVVIKDTEMDRYEQAVNTYIGLEMDAGRFMTARLQQGVYGQRQEGVNMLRIKVPGGQMNPAQLHAIADILEQHAQHDVVHITTRQDIQVHHIPLQHTPAAMRHIAKAGLTTREACNNTVRNITACCLTGLCARELLDITPFVEATLHQLMRHPLTQHLPRKFKISFSGCAEDCAQGLLHDLAVVAQQQDGQFGFKVMAGGGLGHKPRHAITVESFIPEHELLASIEAIVAVHHRYSDRTKRAKSRIKFLVDRFGAEGFVEKYREELLRTRQYYADFPHPKGQWSLPQPGSACGTGAPRSVFAQKQKGFYVFPISVTQGDLTVTQLHGIAELMEREGLSDVRTTQDQNLIIAHVPEARIDAIRQGLKPLGLGEPVVGDDVVACPGTSTCRLGITSSKGMGRLITGGVSDLRIRASGCHNGCAQPETADIGIYGEGKRLFGRLVPHYQFYLGGDGRSGGAIGIEGPEVPAARTPQAVARIEAEYRRQKQGDESFFTWARRQPEQYFHEFLADLIAVQEAEIPAMMQEIGGEKDFKVEQFGGGECSGAVQEVASAAFAEAAYERLYRDTYLAHRAQSEARTCMHNMLRLSGKALAALSAGKITDDLPSIHSALQSAADPLADKLAALLPALDKGDGLDAVAARVDDWVNQAALRCMQLDRLLDLDGYMSKPADALRSATA